MTAAVKRYRYLRKLSNFKQMDFEFALWQMTFLFINPQKVYRNFQHRKGKSFFIQYGMLYNVISTFLIETKLQFARDDPAFLVLLSGLLCGKYIKITSLTKFLISFNLNYFSFINSVYLRSKTWFP